MKKRCWVYYLKKAGGRRELDGARDQGQEDPIDQTSSNLRKGRKRDVKSRLSRVDAG